MENLSFFTTLRPTLIGAWIPAVAMVLVQFVCMALFKEGGKRAVDTSWYDPKTKMYAQWNTIFQVLVIILAVFTLAMIGIIIATASLWLLLMMVPYCWAMHGVILGEERYCEQTYGDSYREYKQRVPRYFLF